VKRRTAVLALLLSALLVACSPNYYSEIRSSAFPEKLDPELRQLSEQPEGVAGFLVDPDTGQGYLVVTTGKDNYLDLHLRLDGGEYDQASRLFTVHATQYVPRIGTGTDIAQADWRMLIQFRKFSFEQLQVVVQVEDSDEQIVYDISVER
jgi:hypothetical protein